MRDFHGRMFALAYALAMACVPTASVAHGEHDWIRESGARSPTGELCCGEHDCMKIPADAVHLGRAGYTISTAAGSIGIKESETLPSEDSEFWLCVRPDATIRCFFAPPVGA